MLRTAIAAGFVLLLCASASAEDTVRLKVGTTIRGKITAESDKEITIQTRDGSMTISRGDIKSIKKGAEEAPAPPAEEAKPAEKPVKDTPPAAGAAASAPDPDKPGYFNVKVRPIRERAQAVARKWSSEASLCLVGATVSFGKGKPYDAGFGFYYLDPEKPFLHMVAGKVSAADYLEGKDSTQLTPTRTLSAGKFVFVHQPLPQQWMDVGDAAALAQSIYMRRSKTNEAPKRCVLNLGYAAPSVEQAKKGDVSLVWAADIEGSTIILNGVDGRMISVSTPPAAGSE
jgi:hypothetical protein